MGGGTEIQIRFKIKGQFGKLGQIKGQLTLSKKYNKKQKLQILHNLHKNYKFCLKIVNFA